MKIVDRVLANPSINPEQKRLNRDQYTHFADLVKSWECRVGKAYDYSKGLQKDAMIRAAQEGRYYAEDSVQLSLTSSQFDFKDALDRSGDAVRRMQAEAMRSNGVTSKDIRTCGVSMAGPDGRSQRLLVYFTRDREPQCFAAEEVLRAEKAERDVAFRSFLAGIP